MTQEGSQQQDQHQDAAREVVNMPYRTLGIEYSVSFPSGGFSDAKSITVSDPSCLKDHVPMQSDRLHNVPGFDMRGGNARVWICKVCNHWMTDEANDHFVVKARNEILRTKRT